jgi:hypothetical protein
MKNKDLGFFMVLRPHSTTFLGQLYQTQPLPGRGLL